MRSFSAFRNDLRASELAAAEVVRLRSLACWAYLLLRPGMEFVRQRSNFILGWQAAAAAGAAVTGGVSAGAVGRAGVPPLGSWMLLPNLTSPATRTVLPSNDALYGAAHVELGLVGPVVLSVPANVDDRYFSVAVMDAHLNNVAHIGPRWTGNDAGDFVVVPPGWEGSTPDGMPVIVSSTPSVCLYNRMLVRYAEGDLERVRAWQSGLRITELSRWGSADLGPTDLDNSAFLHPALNTETDPFVYLETGLEHLRRNPLVSKAHWLADLVSLAGFDVARAVPELAAAVAAGVEDGTAMLDAALTTWPRHNGWMVPNLRLGLPNSEVLEAAAFQQFQIGSNDIAESAYYFTDTDAAGALLDASAGAVFEFAFGPGEAPEVHPSGYWSLTMYDEASLLAENPIDRYATRTDRPGFQIDADQTVRVTLSAELPAGVPEANWLPAPAGRFRLGLRVYYPGPAIIEDLWRPPAVRRRS